MPSKNYYNETNEVFRLVSSFFKNYFSNFKK